MWLVAWGRYPAAGSSPNRRRSLPRNAPTSGRRSKRAFRATRGLRINPSLNRSIRLPSCGRTPNLRALAALLLLNACGSSEVEEAAASAGGVRGQTVDPGAGSGGLGLASGGLKAAGGSPGGAAGIAGIAGAAGPSNQTCPDDPPMKGLKVRLSAAAGIALQGDAVSAWADTSGQNNPAANQADEGRRPTVQAGALGGRPVVHFDGDDDYLNLPFPVNGLDQMTIASVSRTWALQNGSPNNDCDFNQDGLTDVGRELNCSGTDQDLITWPETAGHFDATGIFYAVGQSEVTFRFGTGQEYNHYKTPFVLTQPPQDAFVWGAAVMAGASRRFYLNGVTPSGRLDYRDDIVERLETSAQQRYGGDARPDWPVVVHNAEATAHIGRGRFEPASSFWAGDLAELLIYDAALSAEELSALGAYVRCTYGLD